MVEIPRSSFIPKETVGAVPGRVKRRKTFHVFNFIATLILLGSIAAAGGVFFYEKVSERSLQDTKEKLNALEDQFDKEMVTRVQNFDRKLRAAQVLLDSHIAPSILFNTFEKVTMSRIQFTNLEFEYDPGYEAKVTVQGGTEEFATVALQALQFGNTKLLDNGVFAEISTTDAQSTGKNDLKVNFTVESIIPSEVLQYTGTQPLAGIPSMADQQYPTSRSGMLANSEVVISE